jgi:hypothetical protein
MAAFAVRFRRVASLAAGGLAMFASLAAAPAALGAWSRPVNVSRTPSFISWGPEVGVAYNGRAALMWTAESDPPTSPSVFTAFRGVSGGFGAPVAIPQSTKSGEYPAIAVTNAGRALAMWQEFDGTQPIGTSGETETLMAVKGSLRAPGGRFGPGVTLAIAPNFGLIRVGFTPAGASFAFAGGFAGRWPAGGPLTPMSPQPPRPEAVGANTDTAFGVFTVSRTRFKLAVQRRSRTGVLGPRSRTLATWPCNGDEEEFTCDIPGWGIGLDRDGRGLVAWATRERGRTVVRVANLYASGVLGTGRVLTRLGAHASLSDLRMNARGDAVVVVADGGRLRAATRRAGRSFGAFQTLSALLRSAPHQVTIGPRGDVAITSFTASGDVVAAVRKRGHAFGSVHRIGNTNSPPRNTNGSISSQQQRASVDGRGRVTVTWMRGVSPASGARGRVQVATYSP